MDNHSATSMAQLLLKLGLVSQSQLDEAGEEVDTRGPQAEPLLQFLERKGYLNPYQTQKLRKGDIPGLVLGGYRLKYKIASGSFGRVYRGEDPRTGQSVAIKVLRQRWSNDPHTIDLFQREGKVGMTLHHPNIVQILAVDCDWSSNQYYMVMEFVQGGNLREILTSHKKLPPAKALGILEDAAAGLAHAHSRGLTHRDIKMTNILISVDGVAKLVDFGLAGIMSSQVLEPVSNGHVDVERTVEYAGLERATGVKSHDTRSDIFFLGCVAYEMLTGRAPLRKPKDRHDRMSANRFSQVPQLTRDDVEAPASVLHLVSTMLAFSPPKRYQTPWQLLEAVRAARRDLEAENPQSDPQLARHTVFVVEGDPVLQATLREHLPKLGYRVLLARTATRALDQYRHNPYDLLLLDAGTAKEEGLNVFEQVQREAELRKRHCAGLIVLSQDQASWRGRVAARPHVAVLVRKFKLHELTDKLKELLPPPKAAES